MNCSALLYYSANEPGKNKDEFLLADLSWYNQFLDNHVWEGNGWDAAGTELCVNGGEQVFLEPQRPWAKDLPMSRAHIIRGNQLDNNASIKVIGNVRDLVIERNTVCNVERGLLIKSRIDGLTSEEAVMRAGIIVGKNTFFNVEKPFVTF